SAVVRCGSRVSVSSGRAKTKLGPEPGAPIASGTGSTSARPVSPITTHRRTSRMSSSSRNPDPRPKIFEGLRRVPGFSLSRVCYRLRPRCETILYDRPLTVPSHGRGLTDQSGKFQLSYSRPVPSLSSTAPECTRGCKNRDTPASRDDRDRTYLHGA